MNNQTKCQQNHWSRVSFVLGFILLFPMLAHAHLISISATKPFPGRVDSATLTVATYRVTNISSRAYVTAINQTSFPDDSGLSIYSSTCGSLLGPGQSCTIQVSLKALSAGHVAKGELKVWAKPTADAVQFPINVTVSGTTLPDITLKAVKSTGLPAIRGPVFAVNAGKWLIVSGSKGNFHNFNTDFITDMYVYNPGTGQVFTHSISTANFPAAVQAQLASADSEFLQDGDTLFIIGGFYTDDNINWVTLNTITAINVPGIMNAIINNVADLSSFVKVNTNIPQFRVTGGQLGKIGTDFYLAFGQECTGDYCSESQVYTNSIYRFSTDPALTSINIINTVTHGDSDGSGWRRRDYTLAPFRIGNSEHLFAMAGPFTPGQEADVWTNGISFDANLQSNDDFINQQANQYESPLLSMYSAKSKKTYFATFSGLSNLYWGLNGLVYDNTTPYGNILDLISLDEASGTVQEYAHLTPLCSGKPLASCLYMGLGADFFPMGNYFDKRRVLLLDKLPQNKSTLIGYVYAGLVSFEQNIFTTPSPSKATNKVYAIYVTPSGSGDVKWQNITNLEPGN